MPISLRYAPFASHPSWLRHRGLRPRSSINTNNTHYYCGNKLEVQEEVTLVGGAELFVDKAPSCIKPILGNGHELPHQDDKVLDGIALDPGFSLEEYDNHQHTEHTLLLR